MLTLPAVLTQSEATACLAGFQASLRNATDAVVCADASALTQFDSATLAVLLACRREAGAQGRVLVVKDLPARLRTLASLYGVADLLPAADSAH